MSDQNAADRDDGARIAANRTAVAIAAGSLLGAAALAMLARRLELEAAVNGARESR
ncbi:hypothetical protein [Natrinema salaciae]|uniref:Uncharacterized protein n=1 Tax=Natrinema salaciae TaxID=1186196 RepID=A0A1H9JR16_9EURY|nr:hypothetical protein [Natrinema salaciae]SEQ89277.1 hypothetical protein SAMN04489841_2654 [Natrinema salaciae]